MIGKLCAISIATKNIIYIVSVTTRYFQTWEKGREVLL